jgi:Zn-finger nucleic acid-binding protein
MAEAQTLNCPTCGAAINSDATVCRYCGTRLATISCPHCFGMMFVGSKFCPHCGVKAEIPVEIGPALPCPNCNVLMQHIMLKGTPLQECQQCFGLWVDSTSFDRICADREKQADVLSLSPLEQAEALKPHMIPGPVRYRPCPRCGQLMNRFNFGHVSGVIIDKCAEHGVWFDRDELRRIVDFIQAGGLEMVKQRESAAQTARAREAEAQARADAMGSIIMGGDPDRSEDIMRFLGRTLGALSRRI